MEVRVIVLSTTSVVGETVFEAVTVEDSTTTEPDEVMTEDCVVVEVEAAELRSLDVGVTEEELSLAPVERLPCLFSSLANAASIS